MELAQVLFAGIVIAATGFGLLVAFAIGSMIFAALPEAMGWAAGAAYKRLTKRFGS